MRRIIALSVVFLVACPGMDFGGTGSNSSSLDVEIENQYAESIFTVEIAEMETGERQTIYDHVRIRSYEKSRKADALTIPESGEMWFFVSAMSLGEERKMEPFKFRLEKNRHVLFAYDYDLATATFRFRSNYDFLK